RYAFQFVSFEPAALARELQCASAPSRPTRSAPFPLPVLVTKNDIWPLAADFFSAFLSCACAPKASSNAAATMVSFTSTSSCVGRSLTSPGTGLFPGGGLRRAFLHFRLRQVLEMRREVPDMAERVLDGAEPVAVELILHRPHQLRARLERLRHLRVDVRQVDVQVDRGTAIARRPGEVHLGILVGEHHAR